MPPLISPSARRRSCCTCWLLGGAEFREGLFEVVGALTNAFLQDGVLAVQGEMQGAGFQQVLAAQHDLLVARRAWSGSRSRR